MAESREVKKLKALRRAEFRVKQTWERIDFEEDVLKKEIEELVASAAPLELSVGPEFDVVSE